MIKIDEELKGYTKEYKQKVLEATRATREVARKRYLEMNEKIKTEALEIIDTIKEKAKDGEVQLVLTSDKYYDSRLSALCLWFKENTDLYVEYESKEYEWNEYGDKRTTNTLKIAW
jgi:predicted ATPase